MRCRLENHPNRKTDKGGHLSVSQKIKFLRDDFQKNKKKTTCLVKKL